MKFTYDSYECLIRKILKKGYQITDYHSYKKTDSPCILRHDVDFSLKKAAEFAEMESKIQKGVKATYFVLVSSSFYNSFSKENVGYLRQIRSYGHEIGLHFDEKKYVDDEAFKWIKQEVSLLSEILGEPVTTVSMHRPSLQMLESKIDFFGDKNQIVNSYGPKFFEEFKYLSDSRMYWREDVESIVDTGGEGALHILTHPFWYFQKERDIKTILTDFVEIAKNERYIALEDNLRELEKIIIWKEIK